MACWDSAGQAAAWPACVVTQEVTLCSVLWSLRDTTLPSGDRAHPHLAVQTQAR